MFGCVPIPWMWLSHLSFCWCCLFGTLLKPILNIQQSCSAKQFQLLCCNFEKAFFFPIEILSELCLAKSRHCGWGWPLIGQSVYHYIGCDAVISRCLPWDILTTGNGRNTHTPPLRKKDWHFYRTAAASVDASVDAAGPIKSQVKNKQKRRDVFLWQTDISVKKHTAKSAKLY